MVEPPHGLERLDVSTMEREGKRMQKREGGREGGGRE